MRKIDKSNNKNLNSHLIYKNRNKNNKKSQIGIIISILIGTIFLIVFFLFLSNYRSKSQISVDEQNCKNALEMSRITQNNELEECIMNTIKVNQKMLDKLYVKNYIDLHEKIKKENGENYFDKDDILSSSFKLNKLIADEMVRAWELVNEGALNPFDKKNLLEGKNETRYCLVASVLYFDEDDFKEEDQIKIPLALNDEKFGTELQKDSFFYFLLYNNYKYDKNLSYFDFFSDVDSSLGNYANVVLPIIGGGKITTNKNYYIIYRKTYYKQNTMQESLVSAVVGTMMFSQIGGILRSVTGGATLMVSAYEAVRNAKDMLLEKGVDNLILIDDSTYNNNKFANNNICDIYVNI